MPIDPQAVTEQETRLDYWMNVVGKRANEMGRLLAPSDVRKVAATMVRIACSTRKVGDLDAIIRLHADPTAAEAIRNVMREQNAANAARRLAAAS